MPNNWKTYTVKELIDNKIIYKPLDGNHGGTHPKGSDFIDSGIPFVMASDINDGKVDLKKCKFISKSQADSLRKGFSIEGDVLLTHKASIGRTAIVPEIESDYIMLTPQVTYYRVRNSQLLNNKFLMYYFNSSIFQNEISTRAGSGSTRAYIGITDQQRLSVVLPPLKEQKAIAKILSAIDDKIKNNLAINTTLEDMAMALYKHWFVDFGPFQNGEFVESELGPIPKGWEVSNIGTLYKTSSGGTPSRKNMDYYENGTIPWIKSKELNNSFITKTEEKITDVALSKSSAKLFPRHSVLMAMYGATVGEVAINSFESTCNQAICAINEIDFPYYYLFLYLRIEKNNILNQAVGSAQQNISQVIIKKLPLLKPNSTKTKNIFEEFESIFSKIESNIIENHSLIQLRDTLLPNLISGEVRLKEFQKQIEEVL
jgi:type I restriction enzyme S subunit